MNLFLKLENVAALLSAQPATIRKATHVVEFGEKVPATLPKGMQFYALRMGPRLLRYPLAQFADTLPTQEIEKLASEIAANR